MRAKQTTLQPLAPEEVVHIHERLVADFAVSEDPIEPAGVRDDNLLRSAVGRLTASFAGQAKYSTVEGLAASLFYGICQNHAFHNGNKRTAIVSLLCFLDRNGFRLPAKEDELYDLVTRLASHRLLPTGADPDSETGYVSEWLGERIRKVGKEEYPKRFKDLRQILEAFGCTLGNPEQGFIMVRRDVDGQRLHRSLPYHGETKDVSPGYIRTLRKALELDEDHGYDTEIFYRKALHPDKFITKYRILLRKLAYV